MRKRTRAILASSSSAPVSASVNCHQNACAKKNGFEGSYILRDWHPFTSQLIFKTNMADCTCPRKSVKHLQFLRRPFKIIQFCCQLLAIEDSLKPAWLCDFFFAEITEMRQLISCLTDGGFLTKYVSILKIDMDILIYEKDHVLKILSMLLESLNQDEYKHCTNFICLQKGSTPTTELNLKLKEKLIRNINFVFEQIKEDCLELQLLDKDITPTIFGILLNYPVIYMIDGEFYTEWMDLIQIEMYMTNMKVNCSNNDHNKNKTETIYSFSLPLNLHDKLTPPIEKWKDALMKKCINTSITFSSTTRLQENVIL